MNCNGRHTCKAPSQHDLFKWLWSHPGAKLKSASIDLHMSYNSIKKAHSRLKKRHLWLFCPECFRPSLRGLVCSNCGVELDTPVLPDGIRFEETSPVHSIQPGNGLGSDTNYSELHFEYGARNIEHLVERPKDQFLESAKSLLWEELKTFMPKDDVIEEATRLLVKEVKEFRARYPLLVSRKGVKEQLVSNVLSRLKLRYGVKCQGVMPNENDSSSQTEIDEGADALAKF